METALLGEDHKVKTEYKIKNETTVTNMKELEKVKISR